MNTRWSCESTFEQINQDLENFNSENIVIFKKIVAFEDAKQKNSWINRVEDQDLASGACVLVADTASVDEIRL